ncbi:hypothetical protein VNI00_011314 [Paramarasmius palmivorus]|uniref:Uncharacterized protein n=1 Tax=Paramarasmius palmivorus TaxID=297713 RepID=A0AAW0CET0_9AGAR
MSLLRVDMNQESASAFPSEDDQSVKNAFDLLARHFGRKLEDDPAAVSDLRSFYEKQLEVRNNTIRSLRSLLSSVNAASLRRPVVQGTHIDRRLEFERLNRVREADSHAFRSIFVEERDWESQLDIYTQIMLSMLSAMSGIRIANVEAREGYAGGSVDYVALCSLEVGFLKAKNETPSVFQFTLKFCCEPALAGEEISPGARRIVHYEPIGWSVSNGSFNENFTDVPSSSVKLEELSFFIQGLSSKLVANSQAELDDDPDTSSHATVEHTGESSRTVRHDSEEAGSSGSIGMQMTHVSLPASRAEFVDPSCVPLFTQMPWFSDFVLNSKSRLSMLPRDLHGMAASLLAQLSETYNKPTCRDIILNQATLTPNQKSAGPLVSILFGLRFLDVASVVNSLDTVGCDVPPVLACERPLIPRTAFEGQTGKLRGIASLCDNQGWPRVLNDIHSHMLSAGPVADPTLRPEDVLGSPKRQLLITAFRQLDSISQRDTNLMLVKALHNMESTAFFINYMLQGHFDFPLLWKTLVNELKSAAKLEGVSCEIATNLPPITRLRQPLFLALAVSPLILLCDITPMSSNLTRLHMLRAWYHYGNERPAILKKVEGLLWKELFRMARGEVASTVALQSFMENALPLVSLAKPEHDFFNPRQGKAALMPVGLSYVATESPLDVQDWTSSSDRHGVIGEIVSSDHDVSGDDTDEDGLLSGVAVDNAVSLSQSSDFTTFSEENVVCRWAQLDGSAPPLWTPDSDPDGILFNNMLQFALTNGEVHSDFMTSPGLPLPLFLPPSTGNPMVLDIRAPESTASVLPNGQVRSIRPLQIQENGASPHPVLRTDPLDSCGLSSHDAPVSTSSDSNVSSKAVEEPGKPSMLKVKRKAAVVRKPRTEKLSLEEWRDHIMGDGYLLVSPTGVQTAYWPSSYNMRDLDVIRQLLSGANSYQRLHNKQELFLKVTMTLEEELSDDALLRSANGSSIEGLRILDPGDYFRLDSEGKLSALLSCSTVLMIGFKNSVPITKRLLNDIGSCSTTRECIDLSFRWTDPLVKDIFTTASFLDLINQMERGRNGRSFYFPAIPRRDEKHTTLSLSSNVFSHRYTAGFPGYEISQDTSPLRSNWHFVAPANVLHHGTLAPNGFNTEIHVEAGVVLIFLGQSDEPSYLAAHDSFALSHGVLGGFPSVQGVLLFAGDKMMVLHWHDAIVRFPAEYLRSCREQDGMVHHVPNILSFDGVIQIFSLSAMVLVGGVFSRERYASDGGWKRLDHLYRRCRRAFQEILSVLDSRISFGRGNQRASFGVTDLWIVYLVQQCSSLLVLSGKLGYTKLQDAFAANFRVELEGQEHVMDAVDSVLAGFKFVFHKHPDWSLSLEDCNSFAWKIADDLKFGYSIEVAGESLEGNGELKDVHAGYVSSGLGGVKRRRVSPLTDSFSPVRIVKV